ncbi:hypothetical protein ARMSODRAFT_977014 [Armillaria solidipes]|uniref:Uncharacterized protein n=1 Tax=Armillaria solidipes TaxID=1076256 RepID=A0A2H3BWB2_9AGAR|nr:hypothetical protein ARMSODRAFT_977014 [Armillaria solidipes]
MKGWGSQIVEKSKWSDISLMMKEKWVSILTLQETHLLEEYTQTVQVLYVCDENSTGKAGVAIVLNKDLVKTDEVVTMELIPGHMLLLKKENKEMWEWLTEMWSELQLPFLDRMSGDFNFVKNAIDRLPIHEDSKATVDAFCRPKNLSIVDVSMSGKQLRSSQAESGNKGCWTIPLHLLKNRKALKEVEGIVKEIVSDIQNISNTRTDKNNPQWIYTDGKEKIV